MGSNGTVYYLTIGVSLLLGFFVLDLIRRHRLKEQYALLWLTISLIMLILSVRPNLVERLAHVLGVYYAPSALFLLGFLFLLCLNLQCTIVLSWQTEKIVRLAQEIALLKERLQQEQDSVARQ